MVHGLGPDVYGPGNEGRKLEEQENRGVVVVEYRVMDAELMKPVGLVELFWRASALVLVAFACYSAISIILDVTKLHHWSSIPARIRNYLSLGGTLLILCYVFTNTLLYESTHAVPSLGIQLSRTTGLAIPTPTFSTLPFQHLRFQWTIIPLRTESTFIAMSDLASGGIRTAGNSIFINEGFRRWRVRYYLGIMSRSGGSSGLRGWSAKEHGVEKERDKTARIRKVEVAFEALQPRLPVLIEVYHGLREVMFEEYEDELDTG